MAKGLARKVCTKCGKNRLIKFFCKDISRGDKYHSWCKSCKTAATVRYNLDPANWEKRKFQQWKWLLKTKFNITPEQYQKMLDGQDGRCAICGNPPKTRRLAVDHDHKSRKIRGLLCMRCNYNLLGQTRGTAKLFRSAADYLENPPAEEIIGATKTRRK